MDNAFALRKANGMPLPRYFKIGYTNDSGWGCAIRVC